MVFALLAGPAGAHAYTLSRPAAEVEALARGFDAIDESALRPDAVDTDTTTDMRCGRHSRTSFLCSATSKVMLDAENFTCHRELAVWVRRSRVDRTHVVLLSRWQSPPECG